MAASQLKAMDMHYSSVDLIVVHTKRSGPNDYMHIGRRKVFPAADLKTILSAECLAGKKESHTTHHGPVFTSGAGDHLNCIIAPNYAHVSAIH